jgi:hypothetical protein
MPTSDVHNIVPILTILQNLQPESVLDIGCGFGKYGVLLREYLDIWQERLGPQQWQVRLEAIDAYPQYRNPIWDYVYQAIHVGRAQDLLPTLSFYDVILIADVIEHLERAEAKELVQQSLAKSRAVVISTPREFFAQTDTNHNPFEIHRILWTAADFPTGCHLQTITALSCNLFIASQAPLPWKATYLADLRNVLYLRCRYKLRRLGPLGRPVAMILRSLNRCLA